MVDVVLSSQLASNQSTDTRTRWSRCRWCGAGEALFDLDTGQTVLLTAMHLDGDPWTARTGTWSRVSIYHAACAPAASADATVDPD
jgi:hypothetical protein